MTNKKLKINYPKQNRIPEGAAQLEEKEKQAQQQAQRQQPRKRHQLETYDLVTVDAPTHFPEFEDEFKLHDPSFPDIDLMLDDFIAQGMIPKFAGWKFRKGNWGVPNFGGWKFKDFNWDMPNFNGWKFKDGYWANPKFEGWVFKERKPGEPNLKAWQFKKKKLDMLEMNKWILRNDLYIKNLTGLMLKKLKFDLGDIYNFAFDFFMNWDGLPMPRVMPSIYETETESESTRTIKQYKTKYDNGTENPVDVSSLNNIWSGKYTISHSGNIKFCTIGIKADSDSAITNDTITIPLNFTAPPEIKFTITRFDDQNMAPSVPPHYPINAALEKYYIGDALYPTDISITISGNELNINESFPYTTSVTKCNVNRWIYIELIGDTGKPQYENWRRANE